MTTHNYLFDVKLWASIRLDAPDEVTARARLDAMLNTASFSVYDEDGGQTVTFEASTEGDADLVEVDGEDPDADLAEALEDPDDDGEDPDAGLRDPGWP
jgi:hypothetical protein